MTCRACDRRKKAAQPEPLVPMLFRVPPEHADAIRELAQRTRVPLAVYQREAMTDLLAKYRSRSTAPEAT